MKEYQRMKIININYQD